MTDTTFQSELLVEQWRQDFFLEYVRTNLYSPYMGMDENKIIQLVMDLKKKRGDNITIQLVLKLGGNGVTGDNTLKGNEQSLDAYGDRITVDQRRQGVRRSDFEQLKGLIEILPVARVQLMEWEKEQLKSDIEAAFKCPNLDGSTTYAASTETEKDTWLDANTDRVLFGAAVGNLDSSGGLGSGGNDHSDSLATVDSTTDTLSPGMVSLARRLARNADPHIRPTKVNNEEEWYVMFAQQYAFRDLKNHPTMQQNLREAEVRGAKNPLWRPGDLMYDGVIIREVPEMEVISGAGSGSIDVAANVLCGAQAVGVAWAVTPEFRMDDDDYQNKKGVAVREVLGVQKLFFNDVQHGCVTVYSAAVADA